MLDALTEKDWIADYESLKALWFHDGSKESPHAILTSGLHSDGFFNSRPIIESEPLLRRVARNLLLHVSEVLPDINLIGCVAGPQTGGTKLARTLAEEVGLVRDFPCRWASPAKVLSPDGVVTGMIFNEVQHQPHRGERVLLVEDVLTTGGSVKKAADAVIELGAKPLDLVCAIVNRSGEKRLGDRYVLALINKHISTWARDECPLCKGGSEAIEKPKDNWTRLTGRA